MLSNCYTFLVWFVLICVGLIPLPKGINCRIVECVYTLDEDGGVVLFFASRGSSP